MLVPYSTVAFHANGGNMLRLPVRLSVVRSDVCTFTHTDSDRTCTDMSI